jgi:NAD(P)-dependent dehydrogenase (short-subunit alcohol dehydrogenase family)
VQGDRGGRRRIVGRSLDARKEDEIAAFLQDADAHAPLEVCIFNIGANVNFPILDTTERVFRKVWEMACYSGFLAGREAARLMLPRGQGQYFLHRRHRQPARRSGLRGLRQRQIRPARGGAVDARANSARRTSMSRI